MDLCSAQAALAGQETLFGHLAAGGVQALPSEIPPVLSAVHYEE